MKNPIQPLYNDKHGTLRFKSNKIVEYLLDNGGINLNTLAVLNFSDDDREQFAQLIGYSLSSYSELNYVSDETYETAENMSKCQNENEARMKYLQDTIEETRKHTRKLATALFKICEEDLEA